MIQIKIDCLSRMSLPENKRKNGIGNSGKPTKDVDADPDLDPDMHGSAMSWPEDGQLGPVPRQGVPVLPTKEYIIVQYAYFGRLW